MWATWRALSKIAVIVLLHVSFVQARLSSKTKAIVAHTPLSDSSETRFCSEYLILHFRDSISVTLIVFIFSPIVFLHYHHDPPAQFDVLACTIIPFLRPNLVVLRIGRKGDEGLA